MRRRGSALIIAMLLISAVGAAAFGMGKMIFAETATTTLYENGAIAYYAAESGIEEGFLRYRFNQNTEVPLSSWVLGEDKAYRSNLTDSAMVDNTLSGKSQADALPTGSSSQQLYDLRVGYIGTNGLPFYGQDVNGDGRLDFNDISNANYATGNNSILIIPKDQTLKVDLSGMGLDSAGELSLLFKPNTASYGLCDILTEIKFTVQDVTGTGIHEYKEMINGGANCASSGLSSARLFSAQYGGSANQYYVTIDLKGIFSRALLNPVNPPTSSDKVYLSIKPLIYAAKIGLVYSDCNAASSDLDCKTKVKVVPGPYSYITSTGYYGGVSRQLTANIDRQNGKLYDLYDYVIYKGN